MSRGFVLAPEISRLFGDTVGAFLSRPLPTRSCYDVWRWCLWPDSNNATQESIWMGRQTSRQGGIRFRMLRAQFWTLAQSKYISEGTQKWTLLGSKVVPPGGPVFGPFILSDVLTAMCAKCQARSYFDTNSIRGRNLELGRPVFACLIFLAFFGPKNRPFWMTGRSKSCPNDHLLDSWAGTSACDRPGIPPSPPKQRSKCRCCKESLFYFSILARAKKATEGKKKNIFSIIVWRGAGERAQIWEIVADKVPV